MSDSTRSCDSAAFHLTSKQSDANLPSSVFPPRRLVCGCTGNFLFDCSRNVGYPISHQSDTLVGCRRWYFASLPRDVKYWFGPTKGNHVAVAAPSREKRIGLLSRGTDLRVPGTKLVCGWHGKEEARMGSVTSGAATRTQTAYGCGTRCTEANDQKTIALLKYRPGPILTDLKRIQEVHQRRSGKSLPCRFVCES